MKAALIGGSVAHSISPQLHQAIWPIIAKSTSCKEQLTYEALECTLAELRPTFDLLRSKGFNGANVTFPYKESIIECCDEVTAAASLSRSSNCIAIGPKSIAHSTDGRGLITALQHEWGHSFALPDRWIVYGAGGGARAALIALLEIQMPMNVCIVVRNETSRSSSITGLIELEYPDCAIETVTFEKQVEHRSPTLHLQATPRGQRGQEIWSGSVCPIGADDSVIDLVYNPVETAILLEAAKTGTRRLGGLGMLIEQAALSQMFWITRDPKAISPLSRDQYFDIKQRMSLILAAN